MDYAALIAEITDDPLERGYSGMTDKQVATSLNTADRPKNRTTCQAYEVLEATVPAEYAALSADEKQRYQIIVSAGTVNIAGTNTRAAFAAMFGAGTTTRANLLALQAGDPISRATELGLGTVGDGHVASARAQ